MDGFAGGGSGGGGDTSSNSSTTGAAEGDGHGPAVTTPPYIHLVFLRAAPQASAQGFMDALRSLHAKGRIDRGKVLRVL